MKLTDQEERRYAELQAMALDAARHGESDLLATMLDAGMPVELHDEKGNSLLMLAAYHGQEKIVRELLRRGADPDARNDRGQTPLAGVAFKGHLEIARLLLEGGADPTADQGGGRTPVMFATLFGHAEIVSLLESRAISHGRWLGVKLSCWARLTSRLRRRLFSRRAAT
jgi:ankyrin repeat protein